MNQGRNTSLRQAKLIPRDVSESMGKMPPMACDLEEAVLGAVMLEKNAIVEVVDILRAEDFYSEAHRTIYVAVLDLYKESLPIDILTVRKRLEKAGKLELIGGAITIAELTAKVSSAANIEYHARIISEMAIKRNLIMLASDIHHSGYEEMQDVFELLERVQKSFDEISGHYLKGNWKTNKQAYQEAIERLAAARNKTGITGVPSGYLSLDRITGGWQQTDLIIIAARPSMGKTATVVNIIRNAAIDFKIPVAIFSLEMSTLQLENRMIASEAEIDLDKIVKANYTDYEYTQILNLSSRLSSAPIFIDDTASISILELRAKARRLKAEHGIQMIVVDYLQLMRGDGNNREQEIASISRGLKKLAKELSIPVIALSQLSRGVETRGGDKRPMLADLRESGAIEQDADIVMFLYRPEYYKITQYEDGLPTQGVMEVIIAKHRQGSLDTVQLRFIGKFSKVSELGSISAAPTQQLPENLRPINSYKDFQVSRSQHLSGDKDEDAPF